MERICGEGCQQRPFHHHLRIIVSKLPEEHTHEDPLYISAVMAAKQTRQKGHEETAYVGSVCICAHGRNRTPLSTAVAETSMPSAFTTSSCAFSAFVCVRACAVLGHADSIVKLPIPPPLPHFATIVAVVVVVHASHSLT